VLQRSRYLVTPPRMSSWPLLIKLSCSCSGSRLLNFYSSARGQLMAQWSSMRPASHLLRVLTTSGRYLKHSQTLTFNALFCNTICCLVWYESVILPTSSTILRSQNVIVQVKLNEGLHSVNDAMQSGINRFTFLWKISRPSSERTENKKHI
jgi:hypothetical protein